MKGAGQSGKVKFELHDVAEDFRRRRHEMKVPEIDLS